MPDSVIAQGPDIVLERANSARNRAVTPDHMPPTTVGPATIREAAPAPAATAFAFSSAASSIATNAGTSSPPAAASAIGLLTRPSPREDAPSWITKGKYPHLVTELLVGVMTPIASANGWNTPTPPADRFGALMWRVFRTIESAFGLVPVPGKDVNYHGDMDNGYGANYGYFRVNTPSPTTGVVEGTLGFVIPYYSKWFSNMTYAVTAPQQGSVTVSEGGVFVYTPTPEARLLAAGSSTALTDTFTVTVSGRLPATALAATSLTVTVPIDPAKPTTATVVATVEIGSRPTGVAISPDGRTVYVANQGDGTVSVIDTVTNTLTATIGVGVSPQSVAVSPDGSHAYVASGAWLPYPPSHGTVSVIDTATNTVADTIDVDNPLQGLMLQGVAVSPDGRHLYVANGDSVAVIDSTTNTIVGTVIVERGRAGSVVASPDGGRVYVTNGSSILVIDTATDTVIDNIGPGADAGIALSPDGRHLYAAADDSLLVIDTVSAAVTARVYVGRATGVAVSPDGGIVYVAADTLAMIDTRTNKIVGATGVLGIPEGYLGGLAISPDGGFAYGPWNDKLWVISL